MAQFKRNPVMVQAHRWFRNGDHPNDNCELFTDSDGSPFMGEGKVVRYYRHPNIPGHQKCPQCKNTIHIHGWIDRPGEGRVVCPGDWIVNDVAGEFWPCKPDIFDITYQVVK